MVPFVLLVASEIREVPFPPLNRLALVALVDSSLLLKVTYYERDSVEPWAEGVEIVGEDTQRDGVVIVQPD